MPKALRFKSDQPTPLVLVESAEQQVQFSMGCFVRMVSRLETSRTLTVVNRRGEHFSVSS